MAAAVTTSATSLEGQVMEVAIALQKAEVAASTADITYDNVDFTYDADDGNVSISVTLPVSLVLNAGKAELSATAYLP